MQATIDRIDQGIAVLVTCDAEPGRITVPASLLPEGSREGDVVAISIGADSEATRAAKGRASQLIDRLKSE